MASQQYEVTEIEDMDTWNAVVKKGNEDLNIIDVYAKWCGPCMCEFARTRHRLASRTAIHARADNSTAVVELSLSIHRAS